MEAQAQGSRSLVRKLAEVMAEVTHVAKSGRNEFHRYDYATEADIVASVRKGLSARRVMLLPNVTKMTVAEVARAKGGADRLVTLEVCFTLADGDTGETMTVTSIGEGQDPGDKAAYKAMTGATKYALLKLFLIPTGDDPEADELTDRANANRVRQQEQRPAAPPKAAPRAEAAKVAKAPAPPPADPQRKELSAQVAEMWKRAKGMGHDAQAFQEWCNTTLGEAKRSADYTFNDVAKLASELPTFLSGRAS